MDWYRNFINQNQTDAYWKSNERNDFWFNRYRLIYVIGIGTFGIAAIVEKKENNGNRVLMVVKIIQSRLYQEDDEIVVNHKIYLTERNINKVIHEKVIDTHVSPNFAYTFGAAEIKFSQLLRDPKYQFPERSRWSTDPQMIKFKQKINELQNYIDEQNKKNKYIRNGKVLFGLIGILEMEYADIGEISSLVHNDDVKFIRSFCFGIASGLDAMNIIGLSHRDVGSTNIVACSKNMRINREGLEKNYLYFLYDKAFGLPLETQ